MTDPGMTHIDGVLEYWFGDPPTRQDKKWWSGGKAVDEEIASRFGHLVEAALAGELDQWADSARGRLALIILLDQFTRNMFRGSARAFAGDGLAVRQTLALIESGEDERLPPLQRVFAYTPLEHAEDMAMQNLSVERMESLLASAPTEYRDYLEGTLKYAIDHREIIERFGRYPHRNKALGREPTVAETEYLESGGRRFGQ